MVFTVCAWIFAGTRKKIGKIEGFCMVALYAAYAVYIISKIKEMARHNAAVF